MPKSHSPIPSQVYRDEFDFKEPLRRLCQTILWHWILVLIVTLVTVGLVVLYIKLRPPIFEGEAKLLVEPKEDMGRDKFYDQWSLFRKDEAESEAQLVAGGPVLAAVREELNLRWTDVYHPLGSQLRKWWQHSPIGIKYREIKHSFFPPEPSPWKLTEEQKEIVDTIIDMKKGVVLESVEGTHVGRLVVRGPTPRVAEIANAIARTYIKQRKDRHIEEARLAYEALTPSLESARDRMLMHQQELVDYRESRGVYFDFEHEQSYMKQLAIAEGKLLEGESRMSRALREKAVVDALLSEEEPELISVRVTELNSIRQQMVGQILARELELTERLQRFQPDAPEVKELEELLKVLRENVATADVMVLSSESKSINNLHISLKERQGLLKIQIAGDEEEIGRLRTTRGELKTLLDGLSDRQRAVQEYFRLAGEARAEYDAILEKRTQALVTMNTVESVLPSMRIVEEARPPQDPSWPNTKIIVASAIIVGLMFGIFAAYVKEALSGRLRAYHMKRRSLVESDLGAVVIRAHSLKSLRNELRKRRG